jgi:LacI family transcriptional regulator
LDQKDRPTAIFASNDDMAAAAVAAAHRRRLDVPTDLTVCGFDDTDLASAIWPELTTIRQPIRRMSQQALEFLAGDLRADRAGKPQAASHLTLDYELVRRESDAPPRA